MPACAAFLPSPSASDVLYRHFQMGRAGWGSDRVSRVGFDRTPGSEIEISSTKPTKPACAGWNGQNYRQSTKVDFVLLVGEI